MRKPLIILALACLAGVASAQRVEHIIPPDSTNGQYTKEAVYLARLGVNESEWDHGGDMAAIYQARMYHARHSFRSSPQVGFIRSAIAYSPTVFGRCQRAMPHRPRERCRGNRRRWVLYLRGDLQKPRYWPWGDRAWERRRPDWARKLQHAQNIVDGHVPSPCEHTPVHWGTRAFVRARWGRHIEEGTWAYARCEDVRNAFIYDVANEDRQHWREYEVPIEDLVEHE